MSKQQQPSKKYRFVRGFLIRLSDGFTTDLRVLLRCMLCGRNGVCVLRCSSGTFAQCVCIECAQDVEIPLPEEEFRS